jgi:hypothetical protein
MCTAALHRAVAAASIAAGGGISRAEVVVPAGRFLTGSFSLSSGVYLRLERGAVLLAATTVAEYPVGMGRVGWNWDPALIETHNATHTGIVGEGTIDGQAPGLDGWVGHSAWIDHYDPVKNFLVAKTWSGVNGCVGECRPKLVKFIDCEDVTVTGVTLQNSPDWTQLYRRCNDVLLQNITVTGSQLGGNNDGVDFESGERLRVLDSTFITGDDGIVFASGNTNQNRVNSPGLPVKNVLVSNVTISSKSCAIKWEAIDFGKCNHGNLQDMVIRDVKIFNSSRGIGFQQRNGHGNITNISVSNLEIETRYPIGTNWWGSAEPIWLTNIPSTAAEEAHLGTISYISFTNISILSENGILLSGIGQPIGPIRFESVRLTLVDNLSNTTCRKGLAGAPTGCTDYRPVTDAGIPVPKDGVLLGNTTGVRLEGAGSVQLDDMSIVYAQLGARPSYWSKKCVDTVKLPETMDPRRQAFTIASDGFDRASCNGNGDV